MKKTILLSIVIIFSFLAGCSVEIDGISSNSSKTESFADRAESLGATVEKFIDELRELEKKEKLNSQDQKYLVEEIDHLFGVFEDFKNEDASLLNGVKKIGVKELEEKEKVLAAIQGKAEEGNATKRDVERLRETLSADIEFNLFGEK